MIVRVVKKQMSENVDKVEDLALAAEMAVRVLKLNPMVVGEPLAEISTVCPAGFAKPQIILYYNVVNPSLLDRVKMFLTGQSLEYVTKNMRTG